MNTSKRPVFCAALLAALALTGGVAHAEGITTAYPAPGTYDSIHRVVDCTDENKEDDEQEGLVLSGGGNYTITNGGTITLTKNSTNAYGIQVAEGKNQGTYLTVGGNLTVKIDNSAYAGTGDKVMGVWKLGGYNLMPGGEQPEDQGGKITLNEAEIDVTGKGTAYGLAAGNDFQNNSAGGGTIVVNGNLNVTAHTLSEYGDNSTDQSKTFGAVATDGCVDLNGGQSKINVIADKSNGGINHEIAGLYTSDGGKICSSADSLVDVTVTSKNGGKIYGASSGFYDMVYTSSQGQSGIDLEGTTRFHLDTKGKAAGIHSAYKAISKADTVYIDFLNDESTNAFGRVGLLTETGGIIKVSSLYVGVSTYDGITTVQDPTKIRALATANAFNGYGLSSGAGTIKVNEDGKGTVQLLGQVYAYYKGYIDLTLSNADSYLYGNALVNDGNDAHAGTFDLTVTNGAVWKNVQGANEKDSHVTNLTLTSGGVLDMTDKVYTKHTTSENGSFQNIYVDNDLTGGGGTVIMDIDASTNVNNSDRLYVGGTHTGTDYIQLKAQDMSQLDGAAGTVLVSVKDEQGEFRVPDSEGTLYWHRYALDSKESETSGYTTDWYLAAAEEVDPGEKPTTSVETALSAGSLNYFMWRDSDKLMRRMGDLRHNGDEEKGLWFRMKGTEMSYDGDGMKFKDKYTLYQLGYDRLAEKDARHVRYEGFAFSYGDGESSYAHGSGDNDSYDVSLYRTDMRSKGHYLDLVLKGSRLDNDFRVYDSEGRRIDGDSRNWGVQVSAEYGRKKPLGDDGWYIEPQTQLTFGYLWGDEYTLSNGVRVEQDDMLSLVGRAGFHLGRDIDEKTNVYVKLNVLHEFLGDYDYHMSDRTGARLRRDGDFGDTWVEYGLGAAIRVNDDTHIYFDYERSTGGDFRTNWSWDAGIRWNF